MNRRRFLMSVAGGCMTPMWSAFAAEKKKPRIAFLGTVVKKHSHAQHFLDRLSLGYTWDGRWQDPRVEIASVYIDQFPSDDLGKSRIQKYGLKSFSSVEDALTLGTGTLAVDGVVLIGEHGDYPLTKLKQTRYPRYDWFKDIVKVFEKSQRSVPVFNDKHLSTSWEECVEMVDDSRRLDFPFLAGSSLPVTRRFPAVEMPWNADLTESVSIAYGLVDSYDFHALETAQCMSERRRGGEVGIQSVHAVRGKNLWKMLEQSDRKLTRELLVSALARSHNLPVEGGFPNGKLTYEWFKKNQPESLGYLIEHRDGFRTTILLTPEIRDFTYAGYIKDQNKVFSCQMYLPMPNRGSTTADFFNPLTRQIEDLVLEGRTSYPIERTLLTSGMVIAGVKSLHAGQTKVATPEMGVKYSVPNQSWFWKT
ncbi:hypothetical protein [Thalassoroseus pseudoceratinae]|uniref:hypothetical protein n=1 Tax=Thalassoroseus pseudoceratinae TaxID=2713176 RepID=UPI0014222FC0|nr:hypothetical protein [Thalassoroseus pseudoceratinae]